jgi:hypothetical protein
MSKNSIQRWALVFEMLQLQALLPDIGKLFNFSGTVCPN